MEAGADPSAAGSDGRGAAHVAAARGDAPSLRALLAAGADANAEDARRRRPLHDAAGSHSLECVQMLIDAGARLDAVDDLGWTALRMAAERASPRNVAALGAAGADPFLPDAHSTTPWAAAARIVAASQARTAFDIERMDMAAQCADAIEAFEERAELGAASAAPRRSSPASPPRRAL